MPSGIQIDPNITSKARRSKNQQQQSQRENAAVRHNSTTSIHFHSHGVVIGGSGGGGGDDHSSVMNDHSTSDRTSHTSNKLGRLTTKQTKIIGTVMVYLVKKFK